MGNRKNPCEVCGTEDGPSIYASDATCSVACQKFLSGEFTVAQWETVMKKDYAEVAKNFARKTLVKK